MRKKAFTMAEVMVVLAVIGVLVAILTPTIVKLSPNQNKIMFKKAYYITERVINELINDETYYSYTNDTQPGFIDQSAITVDGVSITGPSKFCTLFAMKINTNSTTINCDAAHSSPVATGALNPNSGNFTTNDGMTWHLPTAVQGGNANVFSLPSATPDSSTREILVDVNGTSAYDASTSPNCTYNDAVPTECPNPDQFIIKIRYDGKIIVDGTKEKEYLKNLNIR